MGTLHLSDRHDPTGRLCALAGRAAAGHDTGGTVCGPCYRDATARCRDCGYGSGRHSENCAPTVPQWVARAIGTDPTGARLPASDRTNGR